MYVQYLSVCITVFFFSLLSLSLSLSLSVYIISQLPVIVHMYCV